MLGFSTLGVDPLSIAPAPSGAGSTFSVAVPSVDSQMQVGTPSFSFNGAGMFSVAVPGVDSAMTVGTPSFVFSTGGYYPAPTNARRLYITVDPRLQGTSLPGSPGPLLQPYPFSPGSRLDIEWDWRPWMDLDDAISSYSIAWEGEELGVISNDDMAADVVCTWLEIPEDAAEGKRSALLCTVTTLEGRIDSRKYELIVKQL